MDLSELQTQYLSLGTSMYREDYLDEHFTCLQRVIEEQNNHGFVLGMMIAFYNESDRLLQDLSNALDRPAPDFDEVTTIVQTLLNGSTSVGAKNTKKVCLTFMGYVEEQDLQGCMMCLPQVIQEYAELKSRLQTLLSLQIRIKAAGGVLPIIE